MNLQNNRYELAVAADADRNGIRAVFESETFDGNIAVQYLRNPDPFASLNREADKAVLLVLRDNRHDSRIIATGACAIRKAFVGGRIRSAGYLCAMKILPTYQKKVYCIPQIYSALRELTKDSVDVYYTTILSDNTAVQKMLEKDRKTMPRYLYHGNYRTYCCKSGGHIGHIESKYIFRQCERREVSEFFRRQSVGRDFSVPECDTYGLQNARFYGLLHDGVLLGAGYLLNQQEYKQYVIRHYGGIYRIASVLPTRRLGYPSFPKVNTAANCVCAGFRVKNNDPAIGYELFIRLLKTTLPYDFVMLGLYAGDPMNGIFSRIRHIKYDSRFYTVAWPSDGNSDDEPPFHDIQHDAAFL